MSQSSERSRRQGCEIPGLVRPQPAGTPLDALTSAKFPETMAQEFIGSSDGNAVLTPWLDRLDACSGVMSRPTFHGLN
jgi:hypothetical protein